MIEPEICFADLDNVMALAEDMIKYIIGYVLENAPVEMEFFNRLVDTGLLERLNHVAASEFMRLPYTEAVEILQKSGVGFEYPVQWGLPLQTEHERYLTEQVYKKPVFVRDYPRDVKSFYMRVNDDGKTAAAADLLVPGIGELIGGSQREERLDVLLANMERHRLDPALYEWYTDLRRYGSVKHGGFGLGFERCVMYITGMKNIRDVIPYPRTPKHLEY
jgi:asparaginyl-tRNA synthetase